jgi:hypothetical protein
MGELYVIQGRGLCHCEARRAEAISYGNAHGPPTRQMTGIASPRRAAPRNAMMACYRATNFSSQWMV